MITFDFTQDDALVEIPAETGDDACPSCGNAMLFDSAEGITYCVNDWFHG